MSFEVEAGDRGGTHIREDTEDAPAIRVRAVSKCYRVYDRPEDRLRQSVMPRLQRLIGRSARQYFREFWALRDVSFEIRKGETLGIIGRNGSGKSTLLQIICGTLTPTSGAVEINGRVAALLELGSGFNPEFTGRENIHMSGVVLGLSREQVEERFEDIVAFADIGDFIEQPVKTYSSGMYVRLAFAVIAHADADILVIDEALSVGDMVFTQKCMRFMRDFMQRGTLLFVSHDVSSVLSLCASAAWIDHGVLRAHSGAKEVIDAYTHDCMEIAAGEGIQFSAVNATGATPDGAIDAPSLADESVQVAFFENIINAEGWTTHLAELTSVSITDGNGDSYGSFCGGEHIELNITAVAHARLASPIIGFLVKDRLGQSLFGQHTFGAITASAANAGQTLAAKFTFLLPMLPNGEYSMTVSIADGTPAQHVQHHWLHDAMVIRVASSQERHGLVGIPFKHVSLSVR